MKKKDKRGMGETGNDLKKGLVFYDWALSLIEKEPKKSGDILKRRFGIVHNGPSTLSEIGEMYGITRERVRQIVNDSLRRIRSYPQNISLKEAEEKIIFTINQNNGIITVESLIKALSNGQEQEKNSIYFFGALSSNIFSIEEKGVIKKSWTVHRDIADKLKEVDSVARSFFKKERVLLSDEDLVDKILEQYLESERKFIVSRQQILSFVGTLERIKKNKLGKWGMARWKEIHLKGTRERVYMALKEKGEPMHFSNIAKLIDFYQLGKRKAHPQTVHNELIKDERFVLVGRGIYALKEWGYAHGTVRDVLEKILRDNQQSLSHEEILRQVLKMRKVKPSTVMINLNNSRFFVKEGNLYSLKKVAD